MSTETFVDQNPKTLASAITSTSSTSITLSDVTGLPTVGQIRALIDNELMIVVLSGSTTVNVVRGVDGSTATTHSNGATVNFVLTAGALAQFRSDNWDYGPLSSRPAAGFKGAVWKESDSPIIARDNGTSWDHFWGDTPVSPIVDVTTDAAWSEHAYALSSVFNSSIFFKKYGSMGYLYTNSANAGSHLPGFIGVQRNASSTVDWTATLGFTPNTQRSCDIMMGIGLYDSGTGGLAIWGTANPSPIEALQTYNTGDSPFASASFNSAVFADSSQGLAINKKFWRAQYFHAQSTSTIYFSYSNDGFNWTFSQSQTYSTLNLSNLTHVGIAFRYYTDAIGYEGPGMSIHHWSYTEP